MVSLLVSLFLSPTLWSLIFPMMHFIRQFHMCNFLTITQIKTHTFHFYSSKLSAYSLDLLFKNLSQFGIKVFFYVLFWAAAPKGPMTYDFTHSRN